MGFDRDEFVAGCRGAAAESDPVEAVREVMQSAIQLGAAIDEQLGTTITGEPDTLFRSDELTVQRIIWPGGSVSAPHEHRMWAVVGVYAGSELNTLFERRDNVISAHRMVPVDAGSVLGLPVDVVHAVQNPARQWTAGLHVYGGDIIGVDRTAWLPDGSHGPQREVAALRRRMVQAMRDLAAEANEHISDERRFVALSALWREAERAGRILTAEEARGVVATAWGTDP